MCDDSYKNTANYRIALLFTVCASMIDSLIVSSFLSLSSFILSLPFSFLSSFFPFFHYLFSFLPLSFSSLPSLFFKSLFHLPSLSFHHFLYLLLILFSSFPSLPFPFSLAFPPHTTDRLSTTSLLNLPLTIYLYERSSSHLLSCAD